MSECFMFKSFFVPLTISTFLVSASPSLTKESSGAALENKIGNNLQIGTTDGGVAASPLQGQVERVELDLEKLQEVGLDLKTALRANTKLYEEVTVQPVRVVTQPNILANGTIVNIPVGTEPTGPPRPARKQQVDLAMKSMKPVIETLKKNVDEFVSGEKQLDLPEAVLNKLQPQFQEWVRTVNTIAIKQRHLEQITYAPPYDNLAIAELTDTISKNLKALEQTRLAIYKVIRKEGRRKR